MLNKCLVNIQNNFNSPIYGNLQKVLCDLDEWPNFSKEMVVDDSQYDAIKHAFTHNVALIQGPPGTGKTLIGAILVDLLLCAGYARLERYYY